MGTPAQGTSYSAPVVNGLAACVISANTSYFAGWPENTRASLILTAQNVDGGYWKMQIDGRDGNGNVSGQEAGASAQHFYYSIAWTWVRN